MERSFQDREEISSLEGAIPVPKILFAPLPGVNQGFLSLEHICACEAESHALPLQGLPLPKARKDLRSPGGGEVPCRSELGNPTIFSIRPRTCREIFYGCKHGFKVVQEIVHPRKSSLQLGARSFTPFLVGRVPRLK